MIQSLIGNDAEGSFQLLISEPTEVELQTSNDVRSSLMSNQVFNDCTNLPHLNEGTIQSQSATVLDLLKNDIAKEGQQDIEKTEEKSNRKDAPARVPRLKYPTALNTAKSSK